jgi:hypothetical protein
LFYLADLNSEISGSPSTADRRSSASLLARKLIVTNNQQQQPSYVEVFIPPRASIVNYFMAKVIDLFD